MSVGVWISWTRAMRSKASAARQSESAVARGVPAAGSTLRARTSTSPQTGVARDVRAS